MYNENANDAEMIYADALKRVAESKAKELKHAEAAKLYLEYAQIFKETCKQTNEPEHAHKAVWGYLSACDEMASILAYSDAKDAAVEAMKNAQKFVKKFPGNSRMQSNLSASYEKLGDIAKCQNDYSAEWKYYMKALEIRKALAHRFPDDPQMQSDLSMAYDCLGMIAVLRNDYDAAQKYYIMAFEIGSMLAEEFPNVPKFMDRLAGQLLHLRECSEDGKVTEEQKTMLLYAAAIWMDLYKKSGDKFYKKRADATETAIKLIG